MREDIELYNTALDCAAKGDWKSTIAHVYQAIALEADAAEYHSLLAVAYLGYRAIAFPVTPIDHKQDETPTAFAIYTQLARQSFGKALAINPGDPLLQSYLPWFFGDAADDRPPEDQPPPPDRSPKPSPPNSPMSDTAANFIDAEAIAQIP